MSTDAMAGSLREEEALAGDVMAADNGSGPERSGPGPERPTERGGPGAPTAGEPRVIVAAAGCSVLGAAPARPAAVVAAAAAAPAAPAAPAPNPGGGAAPSTAPHLPGPAPAPAVAAAPPAVEERVGPARPREAPPTADAALAPQAPPAAELSPAVISTTGLTKVFRSEIGDGKGLKAVDGLDLSVRRGEIFGLLGPNGAGKTTTVGMLTTRVVPTSGTAVVNGVDVVADPPRAKHFIGVVHQLNTLDRSLNAWENLYFHGRYYGMSAKAARQAADEQLERFRLSHRAKSEVRTLSGGMARRLMVARAILHRPAVLFLDEPTASLDPQSRLALWEILEGIRDEGQTILLTTHYMEEADEFCDRVAIMDHGRILALDTPSRLKRSVGNGHGTSSTVKAWLSRLRAEAHTGDGHVDVEGLLDHDGVEAILLEVAATADRLGLSLGDIRRGVTLETVFFHLTGRDLRE